MDGILPLWKPKGMTSHDCVVRIRKLFGTKKVGHTGTLDPDVEGVLPICIGQATKIVPFLTDTKKTYIASIQLGTSTETEDASGKVIEEKEVNNPPARDKIDRVLHTFLGTITQVPPMYSAVKVNGKKLYEYARANETVERPTRQVTIHKLSLLPSETDRTDIFHIKVFCSKGTYIRTLCVDIGRELGFPAHMSHLIRTRVGALEKKNTVKFDTIEEAVEKNEQEQLLIPMIEGLSHLKRIEVDEAMKQHVLNGQKFKKPERVSLNVPFVLTHGQQLLAIYQLHPDKPNEIKPVRVFPV